MITVEAVAVENVDQAIVAGTHYTAGEFQASRPAIPCFDGIGRLPDGTLVVTTMPLRHIEEAWQRTDLRGSRLVIIPD